MEPETTTKFSVVKIIPITVIITILTQVSVLSYYSNFNFSPMTYFESYELVIASIKDFCIIALIVFLFIQFGLVALIPVLAKFDSKLSISDQRRNYKKDRKNENKIIFVSYLLAGLSFLFLFTRIEFSDKKLNITIPLAVIFSGLTAFVHANTSRYYLITKSRSAHSGYVKDNFPYIRPIIFTLFIGLVAVIVSLSHDKYQYIVKYNPYRGSILITDKNETIRCTSKVIFFGKSQKYYFILNKPDSSIRVINRDHLSKETIKISSNIDFIYRF